MSAGILLIDGYNLLHAAGMGQSSYRPGELFRCRTRLLSLLLDKLSAAEIKATTVVFDARDPPPDRPAQVVVSGIRVLFANPGGDADVLIQKWLAHHPSPRRVTLVSSDRVLQRAARSSGAKFIGSEDFVHSLDQRNVSRAAARGSSPAADDNSKPAERVSADQMAHWLKVFGDVPIVEPEEDDQESRSPSAEVLAKSKPAAAGRRRPPRPRKSRVSKDSKSVGNVGGAELAYWMDVFSEDRSTGTSSASPEELRLSDLENWLKEFEGNEGKAEDKRT